MALINCPECGNKVSDKASACPKCGWPLSEMNTSSANNPENIMTTEIIDIDSEKQLNGFTDEKTIVSVEKQIKEDVTKEVSDISSEGWRFVQAPQSGLTDKYYYVK